MDSEKEKQLIRRSCEEIAQSLSLGEALAIIQGAIEVSAKESIDKLSEEQKDEFFWRLFPEDGEAKEQSDG